MSGPVQGVGPIVVPAEGIRRGLEQPPVPGFDQALERLLDPAAPADVDPPDLDSGVVLSRHARARLTSRALTFDDADQQRLSEAIDALQGRGARKALVLTDDRAFIVGVPQRTVITVMGRDEALGQVFTDLDSTYVAG